MRKLLVLLLSIFFLASLTAQNEKYYANEWVRKGDEALLKKDYKKSLNYFQKALEEQPNLAAALRGVGASYELQGELEKAATYYELVIESAPFFSRAIYFECANTFYKIGKYDNAIFYYKRYEDLLKEPTSKFGFNGQKEAIDEQEYSGRIENCLRACYVSRDSTQFAYIQSVFNLGEAINTKGNEYFPYMSNDQSMLYYTAQKDENSDENLFLSVKYKGEWDTGMTLDGEFNTKENEGMTSFIRNGRKMFFTACNRSDVMGTCDIWEAEVNGEEIKTIDKTSTNFNSDKWDSQAAISCDGSTLYFASNRPGGLGGTDIWVTRKRSDGSWSIPKNLGATVNTKYDEEAPFISTDGTTLYFSSNGHLGLGEQDIFVTRLNEDRWSIPINLGAPINSASRELGFFLAADGKTGFFASDRVGGMGGMDIYQFELNDHLYSEPTTFLEVYVVDSILNTPVPTTVDVSGRYPIKTDSEGRFFLCGATYDTINCKIAEKGFNRFQHTYVIPPWDNHRPCTLVLHLKPNITFLTPGAFFLDDTTDVALTKPKPPVSLVRKGHNIYFGLNKTDMNADELNKLDNFIQGLDHPNIDRVEITGYADHIGEDTYNLILSENRAKHVSIFLKNNNVQVDKIKIEGKGEIKNEKTPPEKNRKVELIVYLKKQTE